MKLEKFFRYSLAIGITGAVINLILFATNIYYNLVIPIFEKSMDDGPAFTFIDDLTFYTPLIFMALFLAYLIAGQVYLKIHREKKEDEVFPMPKLYKGMPVTHRRFGEGTVQSILDGEKKVVVQFASGEKVFVTDEQNKMNAFTKGFLRVKP